MVFIVGPGMRRLMVLLLLFLPVAQLKAEQLGPEVIAGEPAAVITGVVFEDSNANGRFDSGESGVPEVLVSNGRDVVATDQSGRYQIPVREDMDLFVVQPAGWRVPVDQRQVPQFYYVHKPGGSTESLRFGGLSDTGEAPQAVNFPLQRSESIESFRCAILGDTQTYSNDEIGFFRQGAVADLIDERLAETDCMIYLGDVVGDDLGLLDRLLRVGAAVGVAQWLVVGNHDLDLDATRRENATDSWRRLAAPAYYAFEIGQATFIVLNNMVFPCGEQDAQRSGREFCQEQSAQYNGRISDVQLEWLENLLAHIDPERLLVVLHHVPLVSFVDAGSPRHQTDNAQQLYQLLEGRQALSLAGHTHALENLSPGVEYSGWREQVGVGPLPFRHIIAGAVSGGWWQGDFDIHGLPMALQRMGAPKGVLMLDFDGIEYSERYRGTRIDPTIGQWISLNTPAFRDWFERIAEWKNNPGPAQHPIPPLSINDLPDTGVITPADLQAGVYLSVNVWLGSRETRVQASIGDQWSVELELTQPGQGEAPLQGAMYADPFSFQRLLTVARTAIVSREGEARAQGYETFHGRSNRGVPQPQGRSVIGHNMHLWQARLPANLPEGVHVLSVISTDRHGRENASRLVFEVVAERPPRYWRHEAWSGSD